MADVSRPHTFPNTEKAWVEPGEDDDDDDDDDVEDDEDEHEAKDKLVI